ncbi:Ger(x)C family spore germination protein [Bacillus sp. JCM 19034]|uniref:Ger(x)C family spore germination protein n=1 Tax=Bacillus sp. JCM 19034 TaxID=1481928 RepID=UPI0007806AC1|nr:Ger(x)C family spore germination protein [Bacillus sp. JCM 19034]
MKRIMIMIVLLLLAGCWDQRELMERAFILGAAIDETEEQLELTVQLYRPTKVGPEGGESDREPATFTVESKSISEGARNLVNYFGRRGNWSHMQIIVIGEETARDRHFNDILAFFYREQEPRATTNLVIGKGKGRDYLEIEPLFDFSSSRQLRELQKISHDEAGNTLDTTLHELSLQLQSQLEVALVPLVKKEVEETIETASLIGVAVLQNGLMVDELNGTQTQHVLVLREQFERGVWKIPCKHEEQEAMIESDNIDLIKTNTRVSPTIEGEQLLVDVVIELDAMIRELMCETVLETDEEINAYSRKIEETVKTDLEKTIKELKEKKIDVLNLGNEIYKNNPDQWDEVKGDWDEYFGNAQFSFNINVRVVGSGLVDFKPFMEAD